MTNNGLEQEAQKTTENMTSGKRFVEGLKAIPPILGCTAGAYMLSFADCVNKVSSEALPDGLNVGYHLAAGSGLYGGWTNNPNKKLASLVALGVSFVPEAVMLAQNGDLEKMGTASAVKLVGYGFGYLVGHIFGQ